VPVSTYRLQFHRGFRFADAAALVPYLDALGITDCYSSPYLKANPGSTHGYDICDHNHLNPEVGSEEEYASFVAALRAHGLGQVVDFVPNHMGIDPASNVWWRDVLENGRCSPFARFFDIEWHPVKLELNEKILLPILGDQYGLVLERGELRVVYEHGSFLLRYFEHNLPINPRQFPRLLEQGLEGLRTDLGDDDPQIVELLSIMTSLRNLPVYTETEPDRVSERHREKEVARERLGRLAESSPRIAHHVEEAVRAVNGQAGEPASFDLLHELLEAQPYRLSYWRTASHEINYRRFFDINQLAGLRMEDPAVFDATHGLILRLIAGGHITGLRLDHVDGLYDPAGYLEQLQRTIVERCPPGPAGGSVTRPFYVVTEKILCAGESLPEHWPVAGTSGYDFLNDLNGVFVARQNKRALLRVYRRFTGERAALADIVCDSKSLIMETPMASELNVLAHALNRLSEGDRRTRDFTLNSLRDALREVVSCFPIYRTYVTPSGSSTDDRGAIEAAIRRARRRNPTMETSIFDFLRSMLLPDTGQAGSPEDYRQRVSLAMKFQQYTGPVQAKGVEDTTFYRYNLLASLNEVGGNPDAFGCSAADFHAANRRRQERWPNSMLASSTHDTKRGEDVRARLNVLSELPEEWGRYLSVWARINAHHRHDVDGQPAPSRNDEYLFYQTLLAAWPVSAATEAADEALVARLREYMLKAVREAKVHTSWVNQNEAYENAVIGFVERVLRGPSSGRFLATFCPFQQRIAQLGMVNSLAQLVLKVASPGVPDFYQGTELWDLSLVDPDNRRPVDYAVRAQMLAALEPVLRSADGRREAVQQMLVHWEDGRIKLFVTTLMLRLRRRLVSLFLSGGYEPIESQGERAEHVLAFARGNRSGAVLAVVPRLVAGLTTVDRLLPLGEESWGDTQLVLSSDLRAHVYENVLTGEAIAAGSSAGQGGLPLAKLFARCPVAVLVAPAGG